MKKFSCERYFPTQLGFSPQQRADFLELEQTLVRETLDEYSEYRTVPYDAHSSAPMSTSVLDPLEWKPVHHQGDLTVYKDRKKALHNGSERRSRFQKLRKPGGGYETIEARSPIPTLLMLGHLRGRLSDTMYGAFADTDNGFRLRTSYLSDELDDSKILHKFEGASLEDPFRFCGILWYVYGQRLGPIMRRRDSVLFIAMGTTISKEGDRIGYTIMHSVDVPELRPLTQYKIQRAYGSLVFVKRQLDDERVELFQKGFFAPMGDVPEFAMVLTLVKGMLRAGNATIEASLSKKLFWMMQDAARLRKQSSKSSELAAVIEGECGGGCKSKLTSSNSKGTCMICRKLVCSNCKVSRKITLEATAENVQQKTLCFCALCVTIARNTSARTIAARDLLEHDVSVMMSSFKSSASSSSAGSAESPTPTDMTASFRSSTRKTHVLWQPDQSH